MTNDGHPPLTDVAALMQERRKYETWLAALEARRATTPGHVFDRVKRDYETRLEKVMGDLLSHREALEQRVRELDERIHGLESGEQQRRDQRAEMELRAHVGELGNIDFEQAVREVDAAIARAAAERVELRDELSKASELLVAVTMPRAMVAIEDPVAANAAAASAAARNGAPAPAAAPVAAPQPLPAAPPAPPSAVLPEPPPPQPMRRPSMPIRPPAPEPVAAAEPPRETRVAPVGEPPAEVRPAAAHEPPAAPPGRVSSFDELAFLQSIVGEGGQAQRAAPAPVPEVPAPAAAAAAPPPQPVEPPRPAPRPPVAPIADFQMIRDDDTGAGSIRASQAAGVVNDENIGASLVSRMQESRPSDESALSSNVTGNHPIVLRPAGDAASAKTLRCNECGSMNYPTEWYCERCGAELAAL